MPPRLLVFTLRGCSMKRYPLLTIFLLALLGLSFCAALSRLLYNSETQAIASQFHAEIEQGSAAFERELQLNLEVLYALKTAMDVIPGMHFSRFKTLSEGILSRSPAIQAFAWAPVIAEDQLQNFEALQQRTLPGLIVAEHDDQGERVPVRPRPWYVPVQFIEPMDQNRAAVGFDLASEQNRLSALEAARDSGRLMATAGIRLVQEPDNQQGFLVFAPLYQGQPTTLEQRRETHYGFINGVFRVGELANKALGLNEKSSLLVKVLDVTDEEPHLLYSNARPDLARWVQSMTYHVPLADVAGRSWRIEAMPSELYVAQRRSYLPALVMVSGALFIALLVIYALIGLHRTRVLYLARQELEKMSLTDGLTELANRRHFDTFIEQEWARANRLSRPLSLIMLDIDFFKPFNDQYGHPAGDECLRQVAQVLRRVIRRPTDLLARYGGEEFAIVLPDTDNPKAVAEACRAAVEAAAIPHDYSPVAPIVTISVGLCSCLPDSTTTLEDLKVQADEALYQAKHAGRNRVVTCKPAS